MPAKREAPSTLSSPAPSHWNSEWQAGGIFDLMPDAIVAVNGNGRIQEVNKALTTMFGYEKEQLLGQPIEILLPEAQRKHHVHHRTDYLASPRVRTMGAGLVLSGRRKDGSEIPIDIMLSPVSSVTDKLVLAVIRDVTERRLAEAKISHMALHDALTNLPNRTFFYERMEQSFLNLGRDQTFALLCLDLDHFKGVNDTLGHPFGDMLLRQVGERLRGCVRESDRIARLGGDEFAVLQGSGAKPTDLTALANRLIEAIGAPYDLDGYQIVVGASIGIAIAPMDASSSDQLLKNADLALYRAKGDGRNTYRFFEPEMDARMQARRAMEVDLRKALVKGEFELYYQPIFNVEANEVSACEALLRWHHPARGMISPLEFISLAEETGIIVPLGEWVLRQACAEVAAWPKNVNVAVNLSPMQFKSKNLVSIVVSALAASGLPARRLELEITESVLLQENDATLATLHQLRGLGVTISMDDFGTGYSSLSYLRKFPFDKIKIDRSFIRDISEEDESFAIVRAVAAIGSSLKMTTTAEGVETREQFDRIKSEGCTEVQGYYFSQPKPAADIVKVLAELGSAAKEVA
jgi:diguanylate cyclase (GGDEF)-like protein/PAS domain S-box-containing protein